MYTTSALFDRRIIQGGKRKTVADIFYAGITVESDIPVVGGSVAVDRAAGIRRTATLDLADKGLVPSLISGGILEPYGTEIAIRQGIVYPDGTEELIPLGRFVLDTTSWNEAEGPVPSIQLVDRAMIMNRAQIGPLLGFGGRMPETVINDLIAYFWGDIVITYGSGLDTLARVPGGVAYDDGNHWDIVIDMAAVMGGEIYWDQVGDPVVNKFPVFDDTTTVNDTVYSIEADINMIDAHKSISRQDVYNSVYVVGQATETSVPRAAVYNNDPASPTYREGPFGKMGIRIENNLLVNNTACSAYAAEQLNKYKRLARTLTIETLPNPALDVGDIINIVYLDATSEPALVQTINYPLAGGTMSIDCSITRL
jgi:hypothetical protein